MCLMTNMQRPYIAKEDITCYKVVYLVSSICENYPRFHSIYFNYNYVFNGNEVKTGDFPFKIQGWTVNNGFHSYSRIGYAESVCKMDNNPNKVIIKCVIPKGASYYVSTGEGEYCSNRIKIVGWKECGEKTWRE